MRVPPILALGLVLGTAIAITSEQLITAPRRSEAIPSPHGEFALFSETQYSFESHSNAKLWNLMNLKSGGVNLLTNDSNVSELIWISSDTVLYINSTNEDIPGGTELWVSDISDFSNSRYKAASLPASFSGLKVAETASGDVNFVLYCQSHRNGTAYNEKLIAKPRSSARIYDSIYIKNLESPYPPYSDTSDYDISPDGAWVAFRSKAPELPKASHTASYIYLVPHDGSQPPKAINGPDSPGTPDGVHGDSSSPSFSPDKLGSLPQRVKWTTDGENLVLNTEDHARTRLFILPTDADDNFKPRNFTDTGSVDAWYNLLNGDVLVSGSAIWTSWTAYTATPGQNVNKVLFSANEIDPGLKGLSPSDVDEYYFKGNWTDIHSWIIYPPKFDKSKTYPLMFWVHGGPQGAWTDSWSTRWNYKTFTDQGYVMIAPNPTGSTGFGAKLTDMIQNNWGSYPYDDLVKCWDFVNENFPFIDTDRGVAAGASYGGFMINWIQGSPLGRRFKALVTHDGNFIADIKIATDELWFPEHDFNGTFWANRDSWRRWDPSAPERIMQFETPQLVIHSAKDLRLPVAEGVGLFNVLQERGVPSRFLNFPDENHWVLKQENSLIWHQQVLGWLNRYSGIEEENPAAISLDDTVIPVLGGRPRGPSHIRKEGGDLEEAAGTTLELKLQKVGYRVFNFKSLLLRFNGAVAMDAQYPLASRDEIWRIFEELKGLQVSQFEQAERIAQLERRRDEDARLKNLWGPSSPFPTPVGGYIPSEPAFNSPPDTFKGFDQGHQHHAMTSSTMGLDADEEPRRGASRANSVRFDESAIHGYYGQASRSTTELPVRTGSGMSSLPLTERSLSHRSDGRMSSSGHSHHSVRTNSLGLDTSSRLLGSSFSASSPVTPPPGWFLLGPHPSIIRCWLTTEFSNETLLYAAVCSGSYVSTLATSIIHKLGLENSVVYENEKKYVRLSVHLPEASIHQGSSRPGSPDPQVPALTIRFLVYEADKSDDTIGVIIGCDALRSHNADILLSKDKILMLDDERNRISIPLVRPENDSAFKSLCTASNGLENQSPIESVMNGKASVGVIGEPIIPLKSSYQSTSAPASAHVSVGDADESKKEDHVSADEESRPATGSSNNGNSTLSKTDTAAAWSSWRRPKPDLNAADKAAPRPMKVLRPKSTARVASSSSIATASQPATRRSSDDHTASTPAANPVGGLSAFPWLNSPSARSSGAPK
ncbi:uncharacterized protein N7483_002282 [Penicillium malachiteum]|uniref:uncharacterized protein n=1 Tax=Penicillium malachiteum TaxID=1324776 RepID=UPI0025485EC8|nr:uncharacterized protein N7483_002282 [Penicillium malachiteum]KAJ5737157.1 hypothetical protein N7483_002282 [Penicillium malachiteum]